MNFEVLKKLANEAREYADAQPYGCGRENEYIWKLSELIVRECAIVAADHDALDIYEEIRKHFGVKE
jgi:hypothetical protein